MSTDEFKGLESEAAGADAQAGLGQEQPGAQPAQEGEFIAAPAAIESAKRDADLYVTVAAKFVERTWQIGVSPETRAEASDKLAPLIVKYDFDGPFVRKWRAEIDAAIFFGGVAYAIYDKVRERKKTAVAE